MMQNRPLNIRENSLTLIAGNNDHLIFSLPDNFFWKLTGHWLTMRCVKPTILLQIEIIVKVKKGNDDFSTLCNGDLSFSVTVGMLYENKQCNYEIKKFYPFYFCIFITIYLIL